MGRLTVSLFGPFQVTLNEVAITRFPTDKERALLAYLLIEADRPHRREALAGLLWGGVPEEAAQSNLRRSIHRLRRALGDDNAQDPILELASRTLRFNTAGQHRVDLHDFNALCAQVAAHRHRRAETCETCRSWREAAAALYRGDLLQGFSLPDGVEFDEWLTMQRERLRLRALDMFEQLAGLYARRGDWDRARQHAGRQIEMEPWRESAHRQLMTALARSGQRAAALAQYEACRRVLADELGIDPEEATTAVYEAIKSGQHGKGRPDPGRSLPHVSTPYFGRESELERLRDRLLDPAERLVTVVGEGGVGKTRFAIKAAEAVQHDFADGVCFVPLAGLAPEEATADGVARAIASALGIKFTGSSGQQAQVLNYLSAKECLLLLDNFEHLLAGAELLQEILGKAYGVVMLVTSRQALEFQAERVIRLDGLPVPAWAATPDADTFSSVRVFAERAERVTSSFALNNHTMPIVIEICRVVNGLPLGIELAAALTRAMPVEMVYNTIRESFDALAVSIRDLPPRHRSMRAVFEGSWQRLTAEEQSVLAQASVFRGGFTHAAALTVFGAADLAALVTKSLLRISSAGRFDLHELLRQFAAEKLSATQLLSAATQKHSAYYLAWVGRREPALIGPEPQVALAELRAESDNLREAWRNAVRGAQWDAIEQGLSGLIEYWDLAGLSLEGSDLLQRAIHQLEAEIPGGTRWAGLLGLLYAERARLLNEVAQYSAAAAAAERAIEIGRQARVPQNEAKSLLQWGRADWQRSDYASARAKLAETLRLARRHKLARVEADGLRVLSNVALYQDDFEPAWRYMDEALKLYWAMGNRRGEAIALNNLGNMSSHDSRLNEARAYYEQALSLFRQIGFRRGEGTALANLGEVALRTADIRAAQTYLTQCIAVCADIGDLRGQGFALENLGHVARYLGDYRLANIRYASAREIHETIGMRHGVASVLACLCLTHLALGDVQSALEHGREAEALASELGVKRELSLALTNLGHVLLAQKRAAAAAEAYTRAIALREEMRDADLIMEAKAGLASAALAQGQVEQALSETEAILTRLEAAPLPGADEPLRVYLTCYQVLHAAHDMRAAALLRSAQSLLNQRAEGLGSDALRRSFLENVAANKQISRIVPV